MDREQCITLVSYLKRVLDYRQARGKQHDWMYLLVLVCGALLSGAKSGQAIAEWIGRQGSEIRAWLQVRSQRVPSGSTIDRLLRHIGVKQWQQILGNMGRRCRRGTPVAAAYRWPTVRLWSGMPSRARNSVEPGLMEPAARWCGWLPMAVA